jgi:hypothetical protein
MESATFSKRAQHLHNSGSKYRLSNEYEIKYTTNKINKGNMERQSEKQSGVLMHQLKR